MRSRGHLVLACAVVAMVGAGACGGPAAGAGEVQILTWWFNDGEKQAMDSLRDRFNAEHPDQPLTDAQYSGSGMARMAIRDRMVAGTPPDTFLANGGWDLFQWVADGNDSQSKMANLGGLNEAAAWRANIPDVVLKSVTVQNMYAVPVGVHRLNTLFFNTTVFEQTGVPKPSDNMSIDDLFALADTLQAAGVTPFATATGPRDGPWPLALLLFENILVARGGPLYYRSFFCGMAASPPAPEAPQMIAAVKDLGRVLASSYVYADGTLPDWTMTLDLVRSGQAAMTIVGDWAKGYFRAKSVDHVDEVPMPGTHDQFVFATDTFGLPKGATNREGALALLRLIGSTDGEDTFNPVKGSTPPRLDRIDARKAQFYDTAAQRTIDAYRSAASGQTEFVAATSILAVQQFMDPVIAALDDFASSTDPNVAGNASVVLYTIKNYYDILQRKPALGFCP